MFKFSFPNPDSQDNQNDEGESVIKESSNSVNWLSSEKVNVLPSHLKDVHTHQKSLCHMKVGPIDLTHISTESALKSATEKMENSSVKLAEEMHSDLVPAKYEGGFKIWECTEDLLHWLVTDAYDKNLKGKYVLDLGCGAGLLGTAALQKGANVVFQDYNKEVLIESTIPNVLLNLSDEQKNCLIEGGTENHLSCEFFSGDWSSFVEKLQEGRSEELKFDYILTSETIYNADNHKKLCNVIKKCLKSTGVVYLAAKTYYFGVGGGLRQFEEVLQGEKILKSEVCWKCPSGVSREIIKITFAS